MLAIKTVNLSKYYRSGFLTKKIKALDNVNLEVRTGEIFGFLGPNGAGKTTTIKILIGLVKPTTGSAFIFDEPPTSVKIKTRIGFLPETPYFYDHLTAEEFLTFCAQLQGLKNQKIAIDSILSLVGLKQAKKIPLRHFSRGMLQRIGIAQALIADPDIVLLDEPMGGLDPIGRKEIRDVIIGLKEQGKTVFFSTHILSDVEMLCSRVGILINGKLISVGVLNEILEESFEQFEVTIRDLNQNIIQQFSKMGFKTFIAEDKVTFYCPNEEEAYFLLEKVRGAGGKLVSFIPRRKTLEDHFIREVTKEAKVTDG
jgi:ABC-2 type transport system ATP-binding protein